jgi:hypothetical protein
MKEVVLKEDVKATMKKYLALDDVKESVEEEVEAAIMYLTLVYMKEEAKIRYI